MHINMRMGYKRAVVYRIFSNDFLNNVARSAFKYFCRIIKIGLFVLENIYVEYSIGEILVSCQISFANRLIRAITSVGIHKPNICIYISLDYHANSYTVANSFEPAKHVGICHTP